VAACSGHAITFVKPHGALANLAETERDIADALARAVRAVDRSLVFLAIALSEQVRAADAAGLRAISEIFADRGYSERGQLLPRGEAGAFIASPGEAAERALRMIEAGAIITAGSQRLATEIGSVCVHSDGPNAAETARQVRARLEGAGIRVAAFSA
jgi:5-oxoprolinase (ATP-hydrolysing) subunit A